MAGMKLVHCLLFVACLAPAMAHRHPRALLQTNDTSSVNTTNTTTPLEVNPTAMDGFTPSHATTCRGEPICLSQVCNPDAYKYNLATEGEKFPYSMSFTKTKSTSDTTFVFMVCQKAALDCKVGSVDPECAPLNSVQLRIRDDLLENGSEILATPEGNSWASCKPQGPGYLWDAVAIGNLSTSAPSATGGVCSSFSVTVLSAPGEESSLADICQQNVTIVDNKGATVLDASALPSSCLITMENTAGITAFGTVTDEQPLSAILPVVAATTTATDPAAVPVEETVEVDPLATDMTPMPYSGGRRRRRMHAANAARHGRLF